MILEDRVKTPRKGEEVDSQRLAEFLAPHGVQGPLEIKQFPAGHSNLTYLVVDAAGREVVVRRAPIGANVKSGHDMGREFRVLAAVHPFYSRVPLPIAFCDDEAVIGAPFFAMSRVKGSILRGPDASGLDISPEKMSGVCESFVQNLVEIHRVDITRPELAVLGHPTGYVARQVEGWTRRYEKAKTDEIPEMEELSKWLAENQPTEQGAALIHNDYKYDNLVLDSGLSEILAVLDWEMATLGDPLMDLGTTLAYWVQPEDAEFLQAMSGPTALPGNYTRQRLAEKYAELSGRNIDEILFYYVYGLFKIGVIGQQIYRRYAQGLTTDPRFGALIFAVHAVAQRGSSAIRSQKI